MNVLIVEDEKLNAEHIAAHIERYGNMNILGVLSSNKDVESWFSKNPSPELIFSDIQLLDGPVFTTLQKGIISCPIIFTTAFDTFYQDAFDANGIAYLLKPVSYERFKKAMDKFHQLKNNASHDWSAISNWINKEQAKSKERILVKAGESLKLLEMRNVSFICTNEGVCTAMDNEGKEYVFRYKIADLAKELNPEKFFQINRGEIVNIDFIDQIEPFFNDRLSIRLKNYRQNLITSSSNTASFRKWLEK
ncbi:response regulator transcription factor [Marivirga sp. S37H4]|uniref:Response regulator transcription factor n=1 Tax=Marivirga aurantiaca TaxID=2802615 RepID=A0A935CBX3_9BACT|nr:LytTR family DNA-binding domain-containing protein [Marivirga aurantiaca]MBK6265618.1 response regulator transcription factor [Marivirga aurantiaca]